MLPSHFLVGALLAIDFAVAQQVYNVNQANPPGTHFTDLPTATATVPSGSVLNVWPGNYAAFTIDAKAMVVNVSPYAVIAADAQGRWCTIRNTSASQPATIVLFVGPYGVPQVTSCAGPVVIQGQDTTHPTLASSPMHSFEVLDCNQVVLRNGVVGAHMRVQNSTMIVESCSLAGTSTYGINPASAAVELIDSAMQLVESSAYGGQGIGYPGYPPPPGAPAFQLTNSSVRVCGTAASTISGGNPGAFSANQQPFAGTGGVRIDPAIVVIGEPSPPAVPIVVQPMSWMTSLTTTYGYPVRATRFSNVNALYAVALSWPAAATGLPAIADPLCIDANAFHVAAVGSGPTPGGLFVQVPVPNHTAFVYSQLVWQSLDLPAAGPWQLTAPSHTIIL